jgi:hypothetical protein
LSGDAATQIVCLMALTNVTLRGPVAAAREPADVKAIVS